MNHINQLYRLIWLSRPLMQNAETLVEQNLQGTGLTVRMRAVLEILVTNGPASVPDLAEKLEIQRQYVQLMVNEAIAAGFALKQPNARHKRSMLIALTDTGETLIQETMAKERAVVADLASEFDQSDVQTALQVIDALIKNLKIKTTG